MAVLCTRIRKCLNFFGMPKKSDIFLLLCPKPPLAKIGELNAVSFVVTGQWLQSQATLEVYRYTYEVSRTLLKSLKSLFAMATLHTLKSDVIDGHTLKLGDIHLKTMEGTYSKTYYSGGYMYPRRCFLKLVLDVSLKSSLTVLTHTVLTIIIHIFCFLCDKNILHCRAVARSENTGGGGLLILLWA